MKTLLEFLSALEPELAELMNRVLAAKVDSPRNTALRKDIALRFLASLLTDDERARLYGLPEGCRMRENTKILSPERLNCGRNVWIGEHSVLDASGGLTIGDHTSIGLSVFLWTHTSVLANVSMSNEIGSSAIVRKPTVIGQGCFVAGHAVVLAGVTVGDRAIVLPGSVVTKDIAPDTMVMGVPARVTGKVDDAFLERMHNDLRETQRSQPVA